MRSSIILVGLMGAGKSSVGRRLADYLGYPFVDMDAYLSSCSGMSIPDLFIRYGETAFRDQEEAALTALVHQPKRQVVSTGGGVVLRAASRLIMRQQGQVLYLHAPVPTLIDRLQRTDVRQRPVLGSREGLVMRVENLYKVRDPLYREVAHAVVETDGLTPKQLAHRLARSLSIEEAHAKKASSK